METKYRFATRDDISLILKFIRALAENEKMSSYVTCTEQDLERSVFDNGGAKIIFALDNEDESKEVGFAIFYYNFSTFMGKRGLYLEDLFVLPEYRGKGYGKALLEYTFEKAAELGYDTIVNFGNPDNYVARGYKSCKKYNYKNIIH